MKIKDKLIKRDNTNKSSTGSIFWFSCERNWTDMSSRYKSGISNVINQPVFLQDDNIFLASYIL